MIKESYIQISQGADDLPHLWFIPGFAESQNIFDHLVAQTALNPYTLFRFDFPGFGDAPETNPPQNVFDAGATLAGWIKKYSGLHSVVLIGHSAGCLISTNITRSLKNLIGFVNIEGNLTAEDCTYSGKFADAVDSAKRKQDFCDELFAKGKTDKATHQYALNLQKASPFTLKTWATSVVKETGEKNGGEKYLKLKIPRIYFFGKKSIQPSSLAFLNSNHLAKVEFETSGHWLMINEPEKAANEIAKFISNILSKTEIRDD